MLEQLLAAVLVQLVVVAAELLVRAVRERAVRSMA
jgi:hypothetical protein